MPNKKNAREIHKRCGIIISGPRVKKQFKKTVGKKARFSSFADKSAAAVLEASLRQLFREAGSHIKKSQNDEERGPLLKPIHIAKALADKKSMVHNVFPKKVAGIYTKTC
jgi:hypothetical protein